MKRLTSIQAFVQVWIYLSEEMTYKYFINKLKKTILFVLLFILCTCNKDNKSVTTRDVLVNKMAYDTHIHAIDSIALEYTDIDSITQFVKRIRYVRKRLYPDTITYKLINKKTKAYLEVNTIKSIYLDTETFNVVEGTFRDSVVDFNTTLLFEMYNGKFRYINSLKNSANNTTYYIFRGRDIDCSDDSDGYWYFDSIFHLKKIYNIDGTLMLRNEK